MSFATTILGRTRRQGLATGDEGIGSQNWEVEAEATIVRPRWGTVGRR